MQVSETHRILTTIAGPMVQLGFNGGGLTKRWDSIRSESDHAYARDFSTLRCAVPIVAQGTSPVEFPLAPPSGLLISQAPLAQLVLVGRISQPHRPQDRDDLSHHG